MRWALIVGGQGGGDPSVCVCGEGLGFAIRRTGVRDQEPPGFSRPPSVTGSPRFTGSPRLNSPIRTRLASFSPAGATFPVAPSFAWLRPAPDAGTPQRSTGHNFRRRITCESFPGHDKPVLQATGLHVEQRLRCHLVRINDRLGREQAGHLAYQPAFPAGGLASED